MSLFFSLIGLGIFPVILIGNNKFIKKYFSFHYALLLSLAYSILFGLLLFTADHLFHFLSTEEKIAPIIVPIFLFPLILIWFSIYIFIKK